jgi:1-acyl-sn-glycerol-3-phosphate acyltransferase
MDIDARQSSPTAPAWRPYAVTAALVTTAAARLWAYQLAACVRGASPERAVQIMQRWNRWAWRRLRLRVAVCGSVPAGPCIYVANHRTYLDIAVLNGALGATFLSRADVASWPVFGRVAQVVGTVFVERDDARGRVRAARALMRRAAHMSVVVFPEATTRGERLPGPFHPGLFRLLRRAHAPVVPVTLRYSDRRAYWVEDLTLWEHLRTRIFAAPPLTCVLHIGEPMATTDYADDAALSAAVYTAVCAPIRELGEFAPQAETS